MIASIQKTVHTAGVRGLFDGISGTWMRQMSYSVCRFWAYDESKKIVGAGACRSFFGFPRRSGVVYLLICFCFHYRWYYYLPRS